MIEVHGVSKSFGTTRALDRVTFSVEENQVLGFLGPNGAGKSTAMKIITTYLSPDEGQVSVDGIDIAADPLAVRNRIELQIIERLELARCERRPADPLQGGEPDPLEPLFGDAVRCRQLQDPVTFLTDEEYRGGRYVELAS